MQSQLLVGAHGIPQVLLGYGSHVFYYLRLSATYMYTKCLLNLQSIL